MANVMSGTYSQALSGQETLEFNEFKLSHRDLIENYTAFSKFISCEYNFSNLFMWQNAYGLVWTLYRNRLLIYDRISECAFMPCGDDFSSEELHFLSMELKRAGFNPDFSLAPYAYPEKYPDINKYYIIREKRDHAEYIYDVASLCKLRGAKLHKKRNLISQFKRLYSDFKVRFLKDSNRRQALELAQKLTEAQKNRQVELLSAEQDNKQLQTLEYELSALKTAFDYFDELRLNGLVIFVHGRLVAFCIFSRLDLLTYDIHFEKADLRFKGAAQIINYETAKHLRHKCRYLNKEQDLGIKGLRQAKMSYEPLRIITPLSLIHKEKYI